MYFENNRRAAENRADADFLRRMLGGELNGIRADRSPSAPRKETNGKCCEWAPQSQMRQPQARREEAPVRPEGGCGCQQPCNTACPTEIPAPSLAMVYAPRQCWRKLFDPEEGLKHGTIFAELVLPFEGAPNKCGKEGCARRPMM